MQSHDRIPSGLQGRSTTHALRCVALLLVTAWALSGQARGEEEDDQDRPLSPREQTAFCQYTLGAGSRDWGRPGEQLVIHYSDPAKPPRTTVIKEAPVFGLGRTARYSVWYGEAPRDGEHDSARATPPNIVWIEIGSSGIDWAKTHSIARPIVPPEVLKERLPGQIRDQSLLKQLGALRVGDAVLLLRLVRRAHDSTEPGRLFAAGPPAASIVEYPDSYYERWFVARDNTPQTLREGIRLVSPKHHQSPRGDAPAGLASDRPGLKIGWAEFGHWLQNTAQEVQTHLSLVAIDAFDPGDQRWQFGLALPRWDRFEPFHQSSTRGRERAGERGGQPTRTKVQLGFRSNAGFAGNPNARPIRIVRGWLSDVSPPGAKFVTLNLENLEDPSGSGGQISIPAEDIVPSLSVVIPGSP